MFTWWLWYDGQLHSYWSYHHHYDLHSRQWSRLIQTHHFPQLHHTPNLTPPLWIVAAFGPYPIYGRCSSSPIVWGIGQEVYALLWSIPKTSPGYEVYLWLWSWLLLWLWHKTVSVTVFESAAEKGEINEPVNVSENVTGTGAGGGGCKITGIFWRGKCDDLQKN